MTDGFRRRFSLASLDAPRAVAAFGDEPRRGPWEATSLVRTLSDTRVWVCDDRDVLAGLERGDFVLFHDTTGVRGVAQVWSVSGDPDQVRRFTELDAVDESWGLVTLTNWQQAKDFVSLLSLGLREVSRPDLLYRVEDEDTLDDLSREYGTPYAMLADVVPDPLQFDVPPDGTPSDRRPVTAAPSAPMLPTVDDTLLVEQYQRLAGLTRLAWGAIAVVTVALALALAGAVTIPHSEPVQLTSVLGLGLALLALAVAIAAGVLVRSALDPLPGLAAVRAVAERTDTALAGMTDARSRAEVVTHRTDASHEAGEVATTAIRRRGIAASVALVTALVGGVVLGYGVGVQVSTALDPIAPLVAVGVPVLVLLTAAFAALFDPVAIGDRLATIPARLTGRR